jgi:hypothetical protein
VASPELEIDVRALSYLVTVVIRRLHDIDPAWCRDLLDELKADRMAAPATQEQAGKQSDVSCEVLKAGDQLKANRYVPTLFWSSSKNGDGPFWKREPV